MKLEVKRIALKSAYTIGKLYIDGNYFCDTLEDTVRINQPKVYGKTAIPAGTYKLALAYSPKFKRLLPLVYNVPGFSGILIHSGNTDVDTEGCLLVGKNKEVGKVLDSRATLEGLMSLFQNSKDKIHTIIYTNIV